jgi:hypothetical protein
MLNCILHTISTHMIAIALLYIFLILDVYTLNVLLLTSLLLLLIYIRNPMFQVWDLLQWVGYLAGHPPTLDDNVPLIV